MSRLLIHDYPLMVSPRLAVAIGLNEAIFLQQLHYWLGTSGKERDGRRWVYNTLPEWNAQFPFWGLNTVRRTIGNLEEGGLVDSTDAFNVIKSDRTKWYTINYPAVEALEAGLLESTGHLPKMGRPSAQNGQVLASAQNGQLLPEKETTSETSLKTLVISPDGEAFSGPEPVSVSDAGETPDALTEPAQTTGKGRKRSHATDPRNVPGAAALLELWNEHRGPLPRADVLTDARAKALRKLSEGLGDDAPALFRDAVREVALDPFWREKRFGLDNLLSKVAQKAEAYRARTSAASSSPLNRRRYD